MLSKTAQTSHGLCRTCRYGLLTLFRYGLGPIQRPTSLASSSLRPKYFSRSFSVRQETSQSTQRQNIELDEPESESRDVISQNVYEALGRVRERPGMPQEGDFHDAGFQWTDDRLNLLAAKVLQSQSSSASTRPSQEPIGPILEALVDSGAFTSPSTLGLDEPNAVESARAAGRSAEDIAREARQIYGEYLPAGVLSEEEVKIYNRLYGEATEEVEREAFAEAETQEPYTLLDQDGEALDDQDDIRPEDSVDVRPDMYGDRAAEIAEQIGGEVLSYSPLTVSNEPSNDKEDSLTELARFQTDPTTVFLPPDTFIEPVQKILSEHSMKQLIEVSERLFGGPGLPDSPLTPRISRTMPQKPIPLTSSQHVMSTMEANAYSAIVWPTTYASITGILVETRKRLGSSWLQGLMSRKGGPSVLDAGGGGVGILAWRDIVKTEWEALHSSDPRPPAPPVGKSTVVTGSTALRQRAAALLDNTTFLPRLPDYVHVRDGATLDDNTPAPQRKQYDVIIAPHTLWPLTEDWERKTHLQNLWTLLNPDGGVLILIEKGVPRGFEAIAGARQHLLSRHIATPDAPSYEPELSLSSTSTVQKDKGMIIAPCTNHKTCPMYPVPGLSRARKDYCSFQQRYIRPPFMQRILGAKARNHDDLDFSYLSVRRGHDLSSLSPPPEQGTSATDTAFAGHRRASPSDVSTLSLPRIIDHPLKRQGHVTIDLCTPSGTIDRWTVPRSFSAAAYRHARRASWGDLWALGAKTRIPRNLRLGGGKAADHSAAGKQARKRERHMDATIARQHEAQVPKKITLDSLIEEAAESPEKPDRTDSNSTTKDISEPKNADIDNDDTFDPGAQALLNELSRQNTQTNSLLHARSEQRAAHRRSLRPQPSTPITEHTQPPTPANERRSTRISNQAPKTSRDPRDRRTQDPTDSVDDLTPQQRSAMADFAAERKVDEREIAKVRKEELKYKRKMLARGLDIGRTRGRSQAKGRGKPWRGV